MVARSSYYSSYTYDNQSIRRCSKVQLISITNITYRTSQGILYVIIRRYKKWAPLVLPVLISALKSTDIDTVKGALHTLRLATIEHTLARNWDFTEDYVMALFEAFNNFDRVLHLPSIFSICYANVYIYIAFCTNSCIIWNYVPWKIS